MRLPDTVPLAARLWLNDVEGKGHQVLPTRKKSIHRIDGATTNVKTSQVANNRARFSLGNDYLKENEYFVFVCGNHRHFYVLPRNIMVSLAAKTTKDSHYHLPAFNINIKKHAYYPGGSPPMSISRYYCSWDIFKRKSSARDTQRESIDDEEFERKEYQFSKRLEGLSIAELNKMLKKFKKKRLIDSEDHALTRATKYYERNPKLSALLEALSLYRCQVCNIPTFVGQKGHQYVETHHIIPRGMKGYDSPENIIVVCPTCHRKFDKGDHHTLVDVYQKLKAKRLFSNFKLLRHIGVISKQVYRELTIDSLHG